MWVIKYGGNAMKDPALRRAVAQEIAALRGSGPVVVVHGGGPAIERALAERGIASEFRRGLRVTSEAAMEVIEPVLTALSKELAQEVGGAIGLTGRDCQLLRAKELGDGFGRVGRIVGVNRELLLGLAVQLGITPVVACLACDASGRMLNVNADWVAGHIAGVLGADLLFLTDVSGVRQNPSDPNSLLSTLSAEVAREGLGNWIAGGMVPKVEAALHALECGACSATIASGMEAGIIARATAGQAGTRLQPELRAG
jgi:acetylglutamate kinase